MKLFPAIDLKGGECVRLLKGDMDQSTSFNDDPAAQALSFEQAGAQHLHIVDLDGAFSGQSENAASVRAIIVAINIPAQLGGGIRDLASIERWLDTGLSRVILGTLAANKPELVREAARQFSGRVAVGIDARAGFVATEGWAKQSEIRASELAKRYEDAGVAAIIYTDIERDGAMKGPNIAETAALARSVSIPVIASGGVSSLADLGALAGCGAMLEGVIAGRAIYDGAFTIDEAIRALSA